MHKYLHPQFDNGCPMQKCLASMAVKRQLVAAQSSISLDRGHFRKIYELPR